MAKKIKDDQLDEITGGIVQPIVEYVFFECKTCGHKWKGTFGVATSCKCPKCTSKNVTYSR